MSDKTAKHRNQLISADERAEYIVSQLSTEEAAGQLRYDAPAVESLGIPAYNWWNEGLHGLARAGTATIFPQSIGLASMFDEELIRKTAEIISDEARAKYNDYSAHGDRGIFKGLTLWSPNINIFRDPRWGRGQETYGEDPFLTARLGTAFVKGLQGNGTVLKTAACAKHFAVHSGPESLRHEFNAEVSAKDLNETYLPAFEALVREAGVESVMGAYNMVCGEPSCASNMLMGKLKEWGFDGYFVSDCWAIRDFHISHKVTKTAPESAAMALKAGCDLNCGNTYLNLLIALDEGLITDEDIRKSCRKLMRTRIRLGMFDESTEYDGLNSDII
ncbi:MAG: glycoside hydrolase family 3 protein, partial [Ruminococcus sp.]|nr:glycoside hydrolase family 3 protein [Ruminococcus sp.]